jgi:hypothetical protein
MTLSYILAVVSVIAGCVIATIIAQLSLPALAILLICAGLGAASTTIASLLLGDRPTVSQVVTAGVIGLVAAGPILGIGYLAALASPAAVATDVAQLGTIAAECVATGMGTLDAVAKDTLRRVIDEVESSLPDESHPGVEGDDDRSSVYVAPRASFATGLIGAFDPIKQRP